MLFSRLIGLLLFRSAPQDLPASQSVLLGLAGLYVAIGTMVLAPGTGDWLLALAQNIVDVAVLLFYTRIALRLAGFETRFSQTFIALVGVNVLFSLLAWPLMLAMPPLVAGQPETVSPLQLLLLGVLLWNMIVLGNVYRHALEFRLAGGILVAIGYFVVSTVVLSIIFPAGGAA